MRKRDLVTLLLIAATISAKAQIGWTVAKFAERFPNNNGDRE